MNKAIEKFINKWAMHKFENQGGSTSPDYEKFQDEYRKVLKEVATEAGMQLHKFNKNHYSFSAVLKHQETQNYYYVSISDVRGMTTRTPEWLGNILYRTMKHEKDWSGGHNNYSSLEQLGSKLQKLEQLAQRQKEKEIQSKENTEHKEEKTMSETNKNVESKEFEAGKRIPVKFSKKQVISTRVIDIKKYNPETQAMETQMNPDGNVRKGKETRVKLPASSQYRDYVFTTTENVFVPHKWVYDKDTKESKDMGLNENMLMVKLFENALYKLTRTPYVLNEDGTPKMDDKGRKVLDFAKQEVIKVTGTDLQKEFDSWKAQKREQSVIQDIKEKGTSSEKSNDEPEPKHQTR